MSLLESIICLVWKLVVFVLVFMCLDLRFRLLRLGLMFVWYTFGGFCCFD